MSSLVVQVVEISKLEPHFNADRLEIAEIDGFDCKTVVGKGEFHPGDHAIYLPVDAVLPPKLEALLFPENSKIKLSKGRIRATRIRGYVSTGMLVKPDSDFLSVYPTLVGSKTGADVADILGIVKYEPPVQELPKNMQVRKVRRVNHPDFKKMTDIENHKYYPNLFKAGEYVWISEKIHGSSVRMGLLTTQVFGFWRKVKKFLRLLPKYEFIVGSRNVQFNVRKPKYGTTLYYETNIYERVAQQYRVEEKLQPGEILYGEIVGTDVQKGYTYGCKPGEYKFFAYDLVRGGKFIDPPEFYSWCAIHKIPCVPTFVMGALAEGMIEKFAEGESAILNDKWEPTQKIREGCVVKPMSGQHCQIGRKVLKRINPEYLLLKENSDWH